ncbi:AraC family transcriptional regulator [Lacinutrix sp. Hel_I_90]|uniref:helix-turn-helix domain-containing protein n=1 Tax=Lacinutrix sp. Hel_I_90 TaxID=1249999 RepID=UPI0006977A13|nr:AraC family transcriptional regulator [Lacinutrix sp. Hel_I_90]
MTINNLKTFFESLECAIGAVRIDYTNDSTHPKEYEVNLDSALVRGTIKGVELDSDILFIEFDVKFNEDITIKLDTPKGSVVNFLYCIEGNISQSFEKNKLVNSIQTYHTHISAPIETEENHLYFPKNEQVHCVLIAVNTSKTSLANSSINKMVSKLFVEGQTQDFIYNGSSNLKITEHIERLVNRSKEGIVKRVLTEGLIYVILSMKIEHYTLDLSRPQALTKALTKSELKQINELSQFIKNFPETDLGVSGLCSKFGLNTKKAQKGFKLMHEKTLNEYIRFVRVTKSEELIKTTDLNISEIVYTLGLTNRSYFSHIFKEVYNCSPSAYKQKNGLAAAG